MTRQALLIVAALTLVTGCSRVANPAMISTASQLQAEAAKKVKADKSLALFNITSSAKMRDGGTIEVRGYTNRSNNTALRVDHAINGKNPGQLLITSHAWDAKGDEEFRPVTAAEAKLLVAPVEERLNRKYIVADTKVDNTHLQEVLKALQALK